MMSFPNSTCDVTFEPNPKPLARKETSIKMPALTSNLLHNLSLWRSPTQEIFFGYKTSDPTLLSTNSQKFHTRSFGL